MLDEKVEFLEILEVTEGLQTAEPLDFYYPQISYLQNREIYTFFLTDKEVRWIKLKPLE